MSTLDRLSARSEISSNKTICPVPQVRKQAITLPPDHPMNSKSLLYYSGDSSNELMMKTTQNKGDSKLNFNQEELMPKSDIPVKNSNSAIHDAILATQLRHINRELTPTISEVYHERNIGLGLAPPLSKLLLNHQPSSSAQNDEHLVLDKLDKMLETTDVEPTKDACPKCQKSDQKCNCKVSKNKMKPWMTNNGANLQEQIKIQSSDLTTADILERETKNKKWNNTASRSKENLISDDIYFSELSRRDEGDGRSVADSQCSSSYNKRSVLNPNNNDVRNKDQQGTKNRDTQRK